MTRILFAVVAKGVKWGVVQNGRVLSSHVSKDTAVMKAREHALKCIPSKLVIYDSDKAQEFEWYYD